MSLLDRGPHTALVTTMKLPDKPNASGRRDPIPDQTLTVKNCSFRPTDAEEIEKYGGKLAETSYSVTHRNWPGGPLSLVEWDGLLFEQVGDTLRNQRGIRTRHTKAFLRATTAKGR